MDDDQVYKAMRCKAVDNLRFAEKVAKHTAECVEAWGRYSASIGHGSEVLRGIHYCEGALWGVRLLYEIMLHQLEEPEQEPMDELCRTVRG